MKALTPTERQETSLLWAIELALDDQANYLGSGHPPTDYGDEWPEAAATKAEQLENLAVMCEQLGSDGMADSCRALAAAFTASIEEYA